MQALNSNALKVSRVFAAVSTVEIHLLSTCATPVWKEEQQDKA